MYVHPPADVEYTGAFIPYPPLQTRNKEAAAKLYPPAGKKRTLFDLPYMHFFARVCGGGRNVR